MTATQQTHFEQKVKNASSGFRYLHFVQKESEIVYSLSLFNLLFSRILHGIFTPQTPYAHIRSFDGYVHVAQNSTLIFYTLADCTKFRERVIFIPVRCIFSPAFFKNHFVPAILRERIAIFRKMWYTVGMPPMNGQVPPSGGRSLRSRNERNRKRL